MDKKILLEKIKDSVSTLILQQIEMKKIHSKEYMEAANYIDARGTFLFFRNQPNVVIMRIFHILDSEDKDNISFKNLISDEPNLIKRFNDIFCLEKKDVANKNSKFKYAYDDAIQTVKKYRNKKGGHDSFNYSLEIKENKFLYSDIYQIIEKIEMFFQDVYIEINRGEIIFSELRRASERKRDEGIRNTIRAAELLREDKERERTERREQLRKIYFGDVKK